MSYHKIKDSGMSWRLLFNYWRNCTKPRPIWLVLTYDGQLLNWSVSKNEMRRFMTSQQQHAYCVRIHPSSSGVTACLKRQGKED